MYYERLEDAIELVDNSIAAYCHYISPNDLGITGGHQYGFYFPHSVEPMFYGAFQQRGTNNEVAIHIRWQKDFYTDSRAKYYGQGTRNENRITRFGRGFEFMQDSYLGSLMVVTKNQDNDFDCYVLSNQDNIESFMSSFNLSVTARCQVIDRQHHTILDPEEIISHDIYTLVESLNDFPVTTDMARYAQEITERAYNYNDHIISAQCDNIVLKWVDAEYKLFATLEEKLYRDTYTQAFTSCQQLIDFSNSILNRRKSRAGKSLEHHLSRIFTASHLQFEEQVITEGNKRPDFIFPDSESYHNLLFPADKLICLGSKTTCKDRWRQVLNEANRVENKHLFTLQQGVSRNQLAEMRDERLTLVVPRSNVSMFHPDFRGNIMDLSTFISMVREKQA